MKPFKVVSIVGARPQFIKAASMTRALATLGSIEECLVHSGQHFDKEMSDIFFKELDIPRPAYKLGIHSGLHGEMTGRMIEAIEKVLLIEKPQAVIVYGDTNSTVAAALAASKSMIPLVHVEAGLRVFDKTMPEEINRIVTDHLSILNFCPTRRAMQNLEKEGLLATAVHSGDIMYDTVVYARQKTESMVPEMLKMYGLEAGKFAIATVHRSHATDNPEELSKIIEYLKAYAKEHGLVVLLSVHPRLKKSLDKYKLSLEGLLPTVPLGYLEFHALLQSCAIVLTDSGGIQKEAYFHRKPCITLRENTEWLETVEAGWNHLWRGSVHMDKTRTEISDYGDGTAAVTIAKQVEALLAG